MHEISQAPAKFNPFFVIWLNAEGYLLYELNSPGETVVSRWIVCENSCQLSALLSRCAGLFK